MVAQGQDRDYAFHTLGWYQFQKLCQTILVDILGQTVQVFSAGNDAGRDAAFSGSWICRDSAEMTGTFTFQIKYSRRPAESLTYSILSGEIDKARELSSLGYLDNYIILTNHTITGRRDVKLAAQLLAATGARVVRLYGPDWLSEQITNSSHLRMLVPRVYGLGDLSEILDKRAYEQAKAILSWMPALKTIVTTGAMQQAARVLRKLRFVLLVGDAMVGKSTAASSLAIAALDEMKLRVLKVRTAEEFAEHWNASPNSKQFFWIDDAFGETIYDESLTRSWGRHLDVLGAAIEGGACVVMTSRSYIWSRAHDVVKSYSFEPFRTGEVVIRLADLTISERSEMLYNHLRMGDQSTIFKQQVRSFLPGLAQVEPFYPEAARRLASPYYTGQLNLTESAIKKYFTSPKDILVDILSRLSAPEFVLLALIFAKSGKLSTPIAYDHGTLEIIRRLGAQEHEVNSIANSMLDIFIRLVIDLDGSSSYRFVHPSFSDAIASMTAVKPEWIDIYIAGATSVSILMETHAGRTGEQGVEIQVPPSHYRDVLSRICELIAQFPRRGSAYWSRYLIEKSGAAFMKKALLEVPEAFDDRYYPSDEWDPLDDDYLNLCARLLEYDLLPEKMRSLTVARMKGYLSHDLAFLSAPKFSGLIDVQERNELLQSLQTDAESLIDAMVERHDEAYDSGEDPDDFYASAFSYIDDIHKRFERDGAVVNVCDDARRRLSDVVHQHKEYFVERGARRPSRPGSHDLRNEHKYSFSARDDREARNLFSDVADLN
jgi:hypothetical protein